MVLLHGFAGTGRAWDPVVERLDPERYTALALDLRGHGARRLVRPIALEPCVDDVLEAAPDRFTLCGYSMGGRIALHVALTAPERVERLVLVATTAGIADPEAREQRRISDVRLAAFVETLSIEAFAERWMAQPIFAGTPTAASLLWREDILRNEPRALAEVLRGLGAGALPPVWDRLGELPQPVTVLAGTRDTRYLALAEELVEALPDAQRVVVAGAGHGLPREAPDAVAAAVSWA